MSHRGSAGAADVEMLGYDFMQRALVAALLVGLVAPRVGIYLVQRRLSLIGDGIGHLALTGVAAGLLTATSPVLTALVAAVVGAVVVELVRSRGRTSGDLALAMMFYGGIAGGVVLVSQADGGRAADLNAYLFGAITTTTQTDLVLFAALTVVGLVGTVLLRRELYLVTSDEEYATASGLPVLRLNLVLAILTAVTVVVSMRVVGLLLISALMIVPVATAQLVSRSFLSTTVIATLIGVTASVSGVSASYYLDTPSGGTIVLLTIGLFTVAAVVRSVVGLRSRRRAADAVPASASASASA